MLINREVKKEMVSRCCGNNSNINKVINLRGKICPYTVIETRDALKEMEIGDILEVITDYKPAATESIPNFCQKKNYPIEVIDKGDGTFRLLIKKEV